MTDTSPGGCATGECLPEEAPAPAPSPASSPAPTAPATGSLAAAFAARIGKAPAAVPASPPSPPSGGPAAVTAAAVATPAPSAPGPAPAPVAATPVPSPARDMDRWREVVDAVRAASPRHGKSLAFGRLIRMSPGEVVIGFLPENDFHRTTVTSGGKALIEEQMSAVLGAPTRLVVDQAAARAAPPSIAEEEQKARAERERSVDFRVRNHAALQAALRILGGEIEHIQVLERERPAVPEPDLTEDAN